MLLQMCTCTLLMLALSTLADTAAKAAPLSPSQSPSAHKVVQDNSTSLLSAFPKSTAAPVARAVNLAPETRTQTARPAQSSRPALPPNSQHIPPPPYVPPSTFKEDAGVPSPANSSSRLAAKSPSPSLAAASPTTASASGELGLFYPVLSEAQHVTAPSPVPADNMTMPALAPGAIEEITGVSAQAAGDDLLTSIAAEIQIQGPGSTPFDLNNQNLVINSFASVMQSVSKADFFIRYYTSDTTEVPNFGRRRLLLSSTAGDRRRLGQLIIQPQASLQDTVFVTLQINSGSFQRAPNVISELQSVTSVDANGSIPVQVALQSYGQSGWGLTLLSTNVVNPATPLDVELRCKSKFAKFCLDGSGLSQGAVKAIIACGCIAVVLVASMLCVLVDIKRRTGRMGELEFSPDTPRTPMQRAVNSITAYLRDALAAVRTPRGGARTGPFQPDTPPTPAAGAAVQGDRADKAAPQRNNSTMVVDDRATEENGQAGVVPCAR